MCRYIIIAGINGAGKSTLYDSEPDLFAGTKRLNADEILQQSNGDWRSTADNLRAMKLELKELHACLTHGKSLHVETTLAGNGKTQIDLITEAKTLGFKITLCYITLRNSELAIQRVNERVIKGGHGIPSKLIQKRFDQSRKNFAKIAPLCDIVTIYDNTTGFHNVYYRVGQTVTLNQLKSYPWLQAFWPNFRF
ncbi:zeta toxin family protein [Levilactobacillus acidifarinae]|nr:zeta toxin family protein [Levilactobacillus acidifarinae]